MNKVIKLTGVATISIGILFFGAGFLKQALHRSHHQTFPSSALVDLGTDDPAWVQLIDPLFGDSVNVELSLLPTKTGGYLLTYQYRHFQNHRHFTIYVTTDSLGNVIQHCPMPEPIHYVRSYSMVDSKGNFIFLGYIRKIREDRYSSESFSFAKLDPKMQLQWVYGYGKRSGYSYSNCALERPGGGWYILGQEEIHQNAINILLMSVDSTGKELWRNNYSFGEMNSAFLMTRATDDDIFITSNYYSNNSPQDWNGVLMKINPKGEIVWNKFINSTSFEMIHAIVTFDDGTGFLGIRYGDPVTLQIYTKLIPFSPDGNLGKEISLKTIGDDELINFKKKSENNFFALSNTRDKTGRSCTLWNISRDGEMIWRKSFLDGYDTLGGNFIFSDHGIVIVLYVKSKNKDDVGGKIALVKYK
ncbi:MAG: hypothetical protein V2A56_07855 [bacterium]